MTIQEKQSLIKEWERKLTQEVSPVYLELKNNRTVVRTRVSKTITSLKNSIQGSDAFEIKDHLETLKTNRDDLNERDASIWILMVDYPTVLEADSDISSSMYIEPATKMIAIGLKRIIELEPPPIAPSHPSPTVVTAMSPPGRSTAKVKLPKLDLPTFQGKSPSEYKAFWNAFSSLVDSDTTINAVQKLQYLQASCTGEALVIAQGFAITADNYEELKAHFQSMFGSRRLVVQSYMENIIDIPHVSQIGLKSFVNSLETSLRSVKEYGVAYEHLAPIVIPLVERKLPTDEYKKWKEHIFNEDDFSLPKFISFLHERVLCLPTYETQSQGQGQGQVQRDTRPKTRPSSQPQTTTLMVTQSKSYCNICDNGSHSTLECRKLLKVNAYKRVAMAKQKGLCYKCLGKSSRAHNCTNCNFENCEKCQKAHHTLLHLEPKTEPPATDEATPPGHPIDIKATSTLVNMAPTYSSSSKLLKTIMIPTISGGPHNESTELRTLIDSGSDESWCTKEIADLMEYKVVGKKTISVSRAFSTSFDKPHQVDVVEVGLMTENNEVFKIKALVCNGPMMAPMPAVAFDPQTVYPHLRGLEIADHYPRGSESVDLVIGAAYEEKIRTGKRIMSPGEGPDAIHTIFGWMISGDLSEGNRQNQEVRCNRIAASTIEDQINRFWHIEEMPKHTQVEEDRKTQEIFESTARFDPEKQQYVVRIPFNKQIEKLESNYGKVKKMQSFQEAKLEKTPILKAKVQEILQQQLEAGIIEMVDENQKGGQTHYIPWHFVTRESETTPIRIVYNLSNKDRNGLSLNSCQTAGPNLLPDILGLLLRFRSGKIGYTLDIQKMFHQVRIEESQQDLHRFFAFGKTYRFPVLIMGGRSSPFCSMAVCKMEAKRLNQALPLAQKVVEKDLYMDDPTHSADSVEEAIETVRQLICLFDGIHMNTHKITSNSIELMEAFKDKSLLREVSKVLGLEWNTKLDCLSVKQSPMDTPSTKVDLLSRISSVYDPLGFHAPLTCQGKILMQQMWKLKTDWRDPIPENMLDDVQAWINACNYKVPFDRCIGKIDKLHVFADASEQAYAAVIYGQDGSGQPKFLVAKTRVKPLRVITLPRMELQAALLGATLYDSIRHQFDSCKAYFYTDSEIVWKWIRSESSNYKVFVGNRISEIQNLTDVNNWLWTPGVQNPADLPSRAKWPLDENDERLWKYGPPYLQSLEFPAQPTFLAPEVEKKRMLSLQVQSPTDQLIDINRFSNLSRLLNSVAYVFRFAHHKQGMVGCPSADERESALEFLIKQEQEKYFGKEIRYLKEKQQVSHKSQLRTLCPRLDNKGLLRMTSRSNNYEPPILPPESPLTQLIIRDCHLKNLHSGAATTLAILRQKFWILRGLQATKKVIRKCVPCRKINQPNCTEIMANLPDFRTTPSNPFTFVGIDYTGPLLITKASHKRYILLFTCASTRAVHLELTRTMNFADFMLAYTRFCSRRGKPSQIISDNAKTFQQASEHLKTENVNWEFITPRAPWKGGFYERIMKHIKEPLKKVIGKAILNEVELQTILVQVEALINERPLTAIHSGDDCQIITPSQLINGRCLAHVYREDKPEFDPTKRMRYLNTIKQQFWTQWTRQYIPTLMTRSKWQKPMEGSLQENDIVLLQKENTKRHLWPLAKVLKTIKGRDGHARTIQLELDGKLVTRPINHAIKLTEQ